MRLSRLERQMFTRLVEWAAAPAAPLPPVVETDALEAFGRYLGASPTLNRIGLRAALIMLELAPVLGPERRRLSRLDQVTLDQFLNRQLNGRFGTAVMALRGLAQISYYGDERVLRLIGYDARAVVARGRSLRQAEGRW